jgi:hypothetical protein
MAAIAQLRHSMDRITQSLVNEFKIAYSLEKLSESNLFERFVNYVVVSSLHQDIFDTADVSVDDDSYGLDGIGIIANGALITTPDEVRDLVETNGYLEVTFIFTQAKTSSNFDNTVIGGMEFAVSDFFKETPQLPQTEFVKNAALVANEIISHSSKFSRGKPTLRLFYASTGKWNDDKVLVARADSAKQTLMSLGLFREVVFTPLDADRLQKLYSDTKNAISREFIFEKKTVIPEIQGVSESYLGLLPASEFLKLIEDDEQEIIKQLFYDNVRDWQQYNSVNEDIKQTLADAEKRRRFALLNNGVTIIAKILRTTANRFHIEDFQIVNGCQTSHVLHDQRSHLDDTVFVPLRVISTQDEDIIRSIITATNRQTQVEEEQFLALSDFQKKLELYFNTFTKEKQVYYERRSRQFGHLSIEKVRIFSMKMLLRAYASLVLEEPHRTTRNYKTLLEGVGKTIFAKTDKLEPYYTAAFALYKLEYFFRNETLIPRYKPARYHILMAFARLAAKRPIPSASSKDIIKVCDAVNTVLWDEKNSADVFKQAGDIVAEVAGGVVDRDQIRSQPFTENLRKKLISMGV